jgi:lysine 2,3-aminomutase
MADKAKQPKRITREHWKASQKDWQDWHWQMRHQIRNADDLKAILPISEDEERGVRLSNEKFRMAITPYYASLIDFNDPMDPIRLQAIPRVDEVISNPDDLEDPLAEDVDSPVPGLTHRYPDRVLLLVTQICSMYCRHCTRRRLVGETDVHHTKSQLDQAVDYISNHPEVRDIVVSGGDPFTLSDENIEMILKKLRAIPHVEIIRIGTRTPVVMPMRITPKLCKMIQKYHPVYINTHFNHPLEITPEAKEACERLANHGMPVGNQSVLLRYINDCPHVMKQLVHGLLKMRVRPYYIYQCDLSMGISHFRTPISRGIEIIESLRGHTSGLAVPTFVVDAPGGGGKIPVMPNYVVTSAPGQVVLRNFEGVMVRYVENPKVDSGCGHHAACSNPSYRTKEGPALMMQPQGPIGIGPVPKRKKRNKNHHKA